MINVGQPVISTESHTQSRRLLARLEKLAPDVRGVLDILLDCRAGQSARNSSP